MGICINNQAFNLSISSGRSDLTEVSGLLEIFVVGNLLENCLAGSY